MIPKNINREHIIKAIKEAEKYEILKRRSSRKFHIKYNEKKYPPKFILSLANRYANGIELDPSEFEGGKQTNNFLASLGFEIIDISIPKKSKNSKKKQTKISEGRHNENCKECKETVKRLLQRIYGKVEVNYKFNIGTIPKDFSDSDYYSDIKKIYRILQDYRGFKNFVKAKTLPNSDFFVPDPGFTVEFDESQHFTRPRVIALRNYPEKLNLGFDKNRWIELAIKLNRKDNDPPFRDEQRAWYDTLRDFSSVFLGVPTVRIFTGDYIWCNLEENNENDRNWFKNLIEEELEQHLYAKKGYKISNALEIGLAFPEISKHHITHFVSLLKSNNSSLDLVIFPEGFESIKSEKEIKPENINDEIVIGNLINRYIKISQELDISIIVGFSIDYLDTSISGDGNDQYCLYIDQKGQKYIYHKHSTSKYNAFFDNNWSIEKNLSLVSIGNIKIGVSICHDMYISLIPRVLKEKGADIWVNISYQNVDQQKWQSVLQTRAIENQMISVCTLHRNSHKKKNRQKEPYAFSEFGKIKLKDLETEKFIDGIPDEERTGKIFYFNLSNHKIYSREDIKIKGLAPKAKKANIKLDASGNIDRGNLEDSFLIRLINLEEFVFCPEKIWKIFLENIIKIPVLIVKVRNHNDWERYKFKVEGIIKGRAIEFSTFIIFQDCTNYKILMAAYRSSRYKASRVFYPKSSTIEVDRRFLKGLESTFEISLKDDRKRDLTSIIHK